MTFQEMNIDSVFLANSFFFFLVIISVISGLATYVLLAIGDIKGKYILIPGSITIAAWILTLFVLGHVDTTRDQSKSILESNVKTKYDVDEIRFETSNGKTKATKTSEQEVQVVVDNKRYIFHLTQDPETWEPTLSDPPIPGGNSPSTALSAEDLLK